MRTLFLSLTVAVMSVTVSYAQKTVRITDEQKEQMLMSGTCEYGWSGAETAFARMQEAFMNCVSGHIIRNRTITASMTGGQEQIIKADGEGHFSAKIVEYNDNGKEAELRMIIDPTGTQYHYKYKGQDYEDIEGNDSNSQSTITVTSGDGVRIMYTDSSSKENGKTAIKISMVSSTEIEYNL